jgi:hypothetical protein
MTWLLLIALAWVALALLVGVLLGRSVRLADHRQEVANTTVPDYIPADVIAAVARQHRHS